MSTIATGDHWALPKTFKPVRYHLKITPNFNDFSFVCDERIELQICDDTVDRIVLHAVNLDLSAQNVQLISSRKENQISIKCKMVLWEETSDTAPNNETVTLVFDCNSLKSAGFAVGDHVALSIDFKAKILQDNVCTFRVVS